MLNNILNFNNNSLSIDLGTANTVVCREGYGIVLNEPSVVAMETVNGLRSVKAVGEEAKRMIGRATGQIEVIRPLKDGVIAEIDIAEQMIKHFIMKVLGKSLFLKRPRIVICVPSGATSVERRAIRDAASNAGASQVWLIEEPIAAALGAGLPINEATGSMVVDVGGGTTEIAVMSLCGLASAVSVRVGGDKMDEAIISYVRRKFNLLIGEVTAEWLKKESGSAAKQNNYNGAWPIKGRDLVNGTPKEVVIRHHQVADALVDPISSIVSGVRAVLENTAPELAADLSDHGIVLTGGGALVTGLDAAIRNATGLPVVIAENPLTCVVRGTEMVLNNEKLRILLS